MLMHCICIAYVLHMHCICIAYAMHIQCICNAYATHMLCIFSAYAVYVRVRLPACAKHSSCGVHPHQVPIIKGGHELSSHAAGVSMLYLLHIHSIHRYDEGLLNPRRYLNGASVPMWPRELILRVGRAKHQTIRVAPDYKNSFGLQEWLQTTRVASDFKSSMILQE